MSIVVIGAIVLLQNLKIIDFQHWSELWGSLWALLLVVAGATVMAGRQKVWGALLRAAGLATALWTFHVVDVDLDLRQAQIKDGAVIEVFALFGGVNIIVPSDVVVENQITSILGGVDDKTSPVAAEKTLYLRGQCMLGGVDVK